MPAGRPSPVALRAVELAALSGQSCCDDASSRVARVAKERRDRWLPVAVAALRDSGLMGPPGKMVSRHYPQTRDELMFWVRSQLMHRRDGDPLRSDQRPYSTEERDDGLLGWRGNCLHRCLRSTRRLRTAQSNLGAAEKPGRDPAGSWPAGRSGKRSPVAREGVRRPRQRQSTFSDRGRDRTPIFYRCAADSRP